VKHKRVLFVLGQTGQLVPLICASFKLLKLLKLLKLFNLGSSMQLNANRATLCNRQSLATQTALKLVPLWSA